MVSFNLIKQRDCPSRKQIERCYKNVHEWISPRIVEVMALYIQGKDLEAISHKLGITTERARQCLRKAYLYSKPSYKIEHKYKGKKTSYKTKSAVSAYAMYYLLKYVCLWRWCGSVSLMSYIGNDYVIRYPKVLKKIKIDTCNH